MADITFRTIDRSVSSVTVLRDIGIPKIVGGVGGWEVVARQKRRGSVRYKGVEPFRMLAPILFDGWASRDSQEGKISRMIRMASPSGFHLQPPQVRINGGTPGDDIKWVIEDIEWGDNVIYHASGGGEPVRYRQDAVIHLLQFVEPAGPFAGSGPKLRYYVVKKGDTLPKIAVKMYGKRMKWKDIAKANNLRDPKKLKIGQRLIIP